MGREYTRQELLIESAAAASRLYEVGGRGDRRRFTDDDVFRFAGAYLCIAPPSIRLSTACRIQR